MAKIERFGVKGKTIEKEDIDKCFGLLFKNGLRPDNRVDVEYAFDCVTEDYLMGIYTKEEYDKLIDELIGVMNFLVKLQNNKKITKDLGKHKVYILEYDSGYYKVKLNKLKDTYIVLEDYEDELTDNQKVYCLNTFLVK